MGRPDSTSGRPGGPDSIPLGIRQHFNDLFDARLDEINRTRSAEERSLRTAVVRRQNSAGALPGLVELYGKKMERIADAWISSWVAAYSFVGTIPDDQEQKLILAELGKLLEGVSSTGAAQLERRRQLTNDWSSATVAAVGRLSQKRGAVLCRAPRDLRLAIRALSSKLEARKIQQSFAVEVILGDQYKAGQVGAMGPHASASDMTFQQIWQQVQDDIDLPALSDELAALRKAMRKEAEGSTDKRAVTEIGAAEAAARKADGPGALKHLRNAGKWALDVATKIGVSLATEAIKKSLGP